ncbi:hypothetical protein [Streptomyces sp. FIT100]|uniref:hypothetical protein n=1 Tax=Streptomyces sp. FIT100 TaxID=2837956 RepID=UPI0021C9BB3A|nr:hypothetical protein [Streptomyces sp. FIT100]UUN26195.1 hypothetical protein KK483_07005 [Streptomyces sp. FIT100]
MSKVMVLRNRNAALYFTGIVASGFGTTALRPVSAIRVKTLTGSDGSDSPAALTVFAMRAPTPADHCTGRSPTGSADARSSSRSTSPWRCCRRHCCCSTRRTGCGP